MEYINKLKKNRFVLVLAKMLSDLTLEFFFYTNAELRRKISVAFMGITITIAGKSLLQVAYT